MTITARKSSNTEYPIFLLDQHSDIAGLTHAEAVDLAARLIELTTPDEQPDREPTPDQERAWDLREDDMRGHALDDYDDDDTLGGSSYFGA